MTYVSAIAEELDVLFLPEISRIVASYTRGPMTDLAFDIARFFAHGMDEIHGEGDYRYGVHFPDIELNLLIWERRTRQLYNDAIVRGVLFSMDIDSHTLEKSGEEVRYFFDTHEWFRQEGWATETDMIIKLVKQDDKFCLVEENYAEPHVHSLRSGDVLDIIGSKHDECNGSDHFACGDGSLRLDSWKTCCEGVRFYS